jgi:hypothetical protein
MSKPVVVFSNFRSSIRERFDGVRVRLVSTVTEFLRTTATRLPRWELGTCRHKTAERNVHRVRCGPELRVTDVTVRIHRHPDRRMSEERAHHFDGYALGERSTRR